MDGACVLMEERDQLVHVVAQERVYVALDELRLRFGERLSGIGYVAALEGGTRALQCAVHGGDGRTVSGSSTVPAGPDSIGRARRARWATRSRHTLVAIR